jgi:hypothetical protein
MPIIAGESFSEQWSLPRNPGSEKILLGDRSEEFNGLNILVSIQNLDNKYVIIVKYIANRN